MDGSDRNVTYYHINILKTREIKYGDITIENNKVYVLFYGETETIVYMLAKFLA